MAAGRGARDPRLAAPQGPAAPRRAASGPVRWPPPAASPGTATAVCIVEAGAGPGSMNPSWSRACCNVCVCACPCVHVRLCASVCLCTYVCLCLCAQPRKVTVQERCQQPRNGLGMESVSQVEQQGWPEMSHSSPSVVTISICAVAMGGAGPATPGHPQVPLAGDLGRAGGPRGAWRSCVGEGCLVPGGARGRGESSRRKGRVQPLSMRRVRFTGGTMSSFTRRPHSSLLLSALLQGCGGQHPSAGEAAGHRGESLVLCGCTTSALDLELASLPPRAIACSTWGRC